MLPRVGILTRPFPRSRPREGSFDFELAAPQGWDFDTSFSPESPEGTVPRVRSFDFEMFLNEEIGYECIAGVFFSCVSFAVMAELQGPQGEVRCNLIFLSIHQLFQPINYIYVAMHKFSLIFLCISLFSLHIKANIVYILRFLFTKQF